MGNPLVSIIIPVYNRHLLIRDTLLSLQKQTYPYWEAIVVDDNSTDQTFEYVNKFSRSDNRIKLFKKKINSKKGANLSRNIGIKKSTGKYVVFLDSDDCLSSECLADRVKMMEKSPSLDCLIFQCQIFRNKIGDTDIIWNILFKEYDDIDRFLSLDTPWSIMSPVWRKEVFEKIGYFDCELSSWQDWEFHIRALSLGVKYKKIDIIDCYYRQHFSDSIGKNSLSRPHLSSYGYLFKKIYDMLAKKDILSEKRRLLLCSLFFWLCSLWASEDVKKSVSIWKETKEIHKETSVFCILMLYFCLFKIEIIRSFMCRYINKKKIVIPVKLSSTFRQCSIYNAKK